MGISQLQSWISSATLQRINTAHFAVGRHTLCNFAPDDYYYYNNLHYSKPAKRPDITTTPPRITPQQHHLPSNYRSPGAPLFTPPMTPDRPGTNHHTPHNHTTTPTTTKSSPTHPKADPTSKYQSRFRGLMAPTGPALKHPAAESLLEYATTGCPVNCGDDWTLEHLDEAVANGAHPSARTPEAAAALHQETMEQVESGFARLIPWKVLRAKLLSQLKISPIAAIPHKSRAYRKIVDLSFALKDLIPSVNDASDESRAPLHAMHELGWVLPRIIHALATVPDTDGPILMAKFDLKDGYWRMVVPEADEYNFAYVLPQVDPEAETMIVVPSALQMGWKLSPPFFCAASETARDVAVELRDGKHGPLPPHPMEHQTVTTSIREELDRIQNWSSDQPITDSAPEHLFCLFEVYIDDFIGLLQSQDGKELLRCSRALMHGIHSIFPPPAVTGHHGHDPISEKKMEAGDGLWATRKELLGWIFDGLHRTMELPMDKVTKITALITKAKRQQWLPRKEFESLRGKLRHAALGLPDGRTLIRPLDRALAVAEKRQRTVQIKRGSTLAKSLGDFSTLLKQMASQPTPCRLLVPGTPGYIGYVDACKTGVGGVWLPGTNDLPPIVWRIPFPPDVQARVMTDVCQCRSAVSGPAR